MDLCPDTDGWSGVLSVKFITVHAAVCINTEHFTKLKQYHNSFIICSGTDIVQKTTQKSLF